jgi:hypothetical protein
VSCAAAELLLTWLDWVGVDVRGWPDLVEEIERLRGAVVIAHNSKNDIYRVSRY